MFFYFYFFQGEEGTGADPCQSAGQSEMEHVWKTFLQVNVVVSEEKIKGLFCRP